MLNLNPAIIYFDKKVTESNNQFLTSCRTGVALAVQDIKCSELPDD